MSTDPTNTDPLGLSAADRDLIERSGVFPDFDFHGNLRVHSSELAKLLLAARAEAPPLQEGAEPVAWRVKDYGDGWITFDEKRLAEAEALQTGGLLEPLYAPSRPVVGGGGFMTSGVPSPEPAAQDTANVRAPYGPPWTVGKLGRYFVSLSEEEQAREVRGAYHVQIGGKSVCKSRHVGLSWETTQGNTIGKFDTERGTMIIWTQPEEDPDAPASRTDPPQLDTEGEQ